MKIVDGRATRCPWYRIALVALGLLAACSDATGPGFELGLAEARWAERGPDDYSFVYSNSCFCAESGPARLTVRQGVVVAAEVLPGFGNPPGPAPDPAIFSTIDDLFERLRRTAARDPDRFSVTFDEAYGYPVLASADMRTGTLDDEFVFRVTECTANPASSHQASIAAWRGVNIAPMHESASNPAAKRNSPVVALPHRSGRFPRTARQRERAG